MGKEEIDRSAILQAPEAYASGEATASRQMDEFVQRATAELEPLHISDDVIDNVRAAGGRIIGTRYFAELYSDDEEITPVERAKSVFVGSVAYDRGDLASEAYSLLATSAPNIDELNEDLLGELNQAIKHERWNGSWHRHENLEAAAQSLGKPIHKRVLSGIAWGIGLANKRP